MFPYFLLALVPAVASIYFPNREAQKRKRVIFATILFFGTFILLLSLKDASVGVDNVSYEYIFRRIFRIDFSQITSKFETEHGYYFLNKIVSVFSKDYQVFMAVVAVIMILPIAIFYGKESGASYLPFILFMSIAPFAMYFSGLRQAVAMAFAIPAFYLAKNKRIILFVLVCLLAMQFHQSAFMLFFLLPICLFKFTAKGIAFSSPILLFAFIFNGPIFDLLVGFMGEYDDKYSSNEATGAFMMTLLFVMFTIYVFIVMDEEKMTKTDIALRNIMVVALVLQIFSAADALAMRMNYYFLPFIPVLLSRVEDVCKEKYIQVVKLANAVFICFFALYFFYKATTGEDILEIFPYKFFWE